MTGQTGLVTFTSSQCGVRTGGTSGEGLPSRVRIKTSRSQAFSESDITTVATALLASNPNPSDEQIRSAMAGNICRCGMYSRIHRAIRDVADKGAVATWEPTAQAQEVQHG